MEAEHDAFTLGVTFLHGEAGVAFAVWAPNADFVSVVGTFNDWTATSHPLARGNGGVWNIVVHGAKVGDEYRYVIHNKGAVLYRIDPRALKLTNSVGNGVLWRPPSVDSKKDFKAPSLNTMILYELHIGTFNATKEKGPGSFASAMEKLPYLLALGINAIELMPVTEFAGDFSWGYNPSLPWAVKSTYGGPEGFIAFVEASHAHGIAVILDVVYNHFGPADLALWQFDGWSENGLGGIYFYNDWRAGTPWGESRPDYGRGEVRSYICDNALMWASVYGVDGLRWDSTIYVRTYRGTGPPQDPSDDIPDGWTLCQWLNDELHARNKDFLTFAEDFKNNSWIVKTTGEGGAGFSAQWDGSFVHPVRAALSSVNDSERNLDSIVSAIRNTYNGDAFRRVIFCESHDEVANGQARMPSQIDSAVSDSFSARKRSTLGAVLVLTSPGVPMLFQGQEFLEDGYFRDEVPLDWSKFDEHHGIHVLYKDLIGLRLNRGRVSKGLSGQHVEINHVNHDQKVMGYRRWCAGEEKDSVMIVVNFSAFSVKKYDIGVPIGGNWIVRFNSDGKKYSGDFADEGPSTAIARPNPLDGYCERITVELAPYSALILSQDCK